MKHTLVIFAFSFAVSAFAAKENHTWFDLEVSSIGDRWPADGSDYTNGYKCVVHNTAAGKYAEGVISVASETPLEVIPISTAPVIDSRQSVIQCAMKMEPFAEDSLPEFPDGAKFASIAVISADSTNLWVMSGTDSLCWTNTLIALDIAEPVDVKVTVTNDEQGAVCTAWEVKGETFVCRVPGFDRMEAVGFSGRCEVSSCWADTKKIGEQFPFFFDGLPPEVVVTITNAQGSVLVPEDDGFYYYLTGKTLFINYGLPEGWCFNGYGERERSETYFKEPGSCVDPVSILPFGRGIFGMEFGPEDGWNVVLAADMSLIGHYTALTDAMAAQKDGYEIFPCYSQSRREIAVAADGRSVTVGGETIPAKPRYHYIDDEGWLGLAIDACEADVVSLAEDPESEGDVRVGGVSESCPDFFYSAVWADDVGFTVDPGESERQMGTGGPLEVRAPKGDKGRRFYRIKVTDR